MAEIFLRDNNQVDKDSAVLLTVSCAIGFVFYMINSEIVCYYKIVGAYTQAHIMYLAEGLVMPIAFEIILGELFGVKGFCMS